ncbi:glycosyltransferase [Megalodesulfovibrio paquesii]
MLILMLAENDPAGTAIRFAKAVNACTDHHCRVVTAQTRYAHAWEPDLHVPDLDPAGLDELEGLLRRADVFHFHMVIDEHYAFGPFTPRDYLRGKRIVHHHHGHHDFRSNPEKFRHKYQQLGRRRLLVSTPDLRCLLPEARWQPNLVPLPEAIPPLPPCPPLIISHAPTRKDLKNTDELLRIVARLQPAFPQLALDLIDNVPHVDCLARKAHSHLTFDHMQGYYGMSSLESLAMGRPVIAGLSGHTRRTICETLGCETLPWLQACTGAELEALLRSLLQDPDTLAFLAGSASRSRQFMEAHWSPERIVGMLLEAYE